jgi:hypothetical protein
MINLSLEWEGGIYGIIPSHGWEGGIYGIIPSHGWEGGILAH